jgi:hypothetical protein
VLCDILDVGEALVQFGNCHFPERSNEGRAVLAADFKRLMQEYLGKLGSVFVPGAVDDKLPGNLHVSGRVCVGGGGGASGRRQQRGSMLAVFNGAPGGVAWR